MAQKVDGLRGLAAWYREFAERAGNPVIWDARLRMAETLEAEANHVRSRAVRMRQASRRAREAVGKFDDAAGKLETASLALALALRAEDLERHCGSEADTDIASPNMQYLLSPTRPLQEICREIGYDGHGEHCAECAMAAPCSSETRKRSVCSFV
jgi:hypothetical protein